MRLRTFESFWLLKNGLLYTYPSLKDDLTTEILVVGAGITGALISDVLVSMGHKVVLIDSRDVGQGSTSATTSMLQYEIDEPLYKLSKKIGEEGAALCYKEGVKSIKELQNIIRKNKIDCGFEMKKSLYIAHSWRASQNLYKEYEIRKKYSLGVTWLEAKEVLQNYGIKSYGAILSDVAASVDAYKLAHELISKNAQKGMKIYDQTTIRKIVTKNKNPHVLTEEGHKIYAHKIIFCTGFESLNLLNEKVADLLYTYASVSEPNPELYAVYKDILIWDTNNPYLYMRTTDDGRFLIGGEDSSYSGSMLQQNIKEQKSKKLIKKLKKTIPDIQYTEDISWGGAFGITKDGLPYIGESPEYKNCYFVLGFGGNGITFSTQGRKIIQDLFQGKENKLAYYYRFGR